MPEQPAPASAPTISAHSGDRRAVTVLSQPGDNLMIHACIEQCGPGDVLVGTTTSPSTDGMFGELFATQLIARGVRGLVIDAGVRDVAELTALGFPVWSRAVSAQGKREQFQAGVLGLDVYGMRDTLARLGVTYVDQPADGSPLC
ncbi:RraA family protein [Modestobacter lapidis]